MVNRITQSGKTRNYIAYFESEFAKGSPEIILCAAGRAATKAIMVVEVLKQKFKLNQSNSISVVENKSVLTITLSLDDVGAVGLSDMDVVE